MCLLRLGPKYAPDVGGRCHRAAACFLFAEWMRYLHHQARWQELKRSEWLVILWVANARKIPTAVLDSVGQVYRQPIATIRDINLHFKMTQKSKAMGDESCFRETTNRIRFGASRFQRNANLCRSPTSRWGFCSFVALMRSPSPLSAAI
jgi:hypothetical protein